MKIDRKTQRELQRIREELATVSLVLPGSLLNRYARCGKARCRCSADPPTLHGPWWSWTRKVHGKTVTVRLTDEQVRDYQPWFDNARRLRELTAQLEQLTLRLLDTDPQHTT